MKLKYALHEVDVRTGDGDLPLLSVSIHNGVVPRRDITDDEHRADDISIYKRCQPSDIVVNRMRAFQGALGVAPEAGLASPDYAVLRADSRHDPRFVAYALRSGWGVGEMSARLRGIGGSGTNGAVRTPRINVSDLGDIDAWLPSHDKQTSIADFLDRECARIGALSEQLEDIVHVANSEWTHRQEYQLRVHADTWGSTKLGWHVDVQSGFAFPSDEFEHSDDDSVRLLRGINVAPGHLRWTETVFWPSSKISAVSRFLLNEGDLVVGMDRPWIGSGFRVARVAASDLPALLLQRVARLRSRNASVDLGYVEAWLESAAFRAATETSMTGVSVPHISPGQIAAFRFAAAPVDEQRRFETARNAARRTIEQLRSEVNGLAGVVTEYRDALITEAVTGKLDVTKLSESQMDESLAAVRAGERSEVLSS